MANVGCRVVFVDRALHQVKGDHPVEAYQSNDDHVFLANTWIKATCKLTRITSSTTRCKSNFHTLADIPLLQVFQVVVETRTLGHASLTRSQVQCCLVDVSSGVGKAIGVAPAATADR